MRIGDVAVIAGEPVELIGRPRRLALHGQPPRLLHRARGGAARAEAGGAPGDVVALGAVQEEITFGGARTSAFALQPDVAIVVDVTHATDAPGIDVKQELGTHQFGSGAVIERGSTLHPMVFELLHDAAEREGIPFTVSASARGTGTDADAIHFSRAGVPTGLVSIPCATCTPPSRWSSSRTSMRARGSSPRSRGRCRPRRSSCGDDRLGEPGRRPLDVPRCEPARAAAPP